MIQKDSSQSFFELWSEIAADPPERSFLKVSKIEEARVLNYGFASFWKRIQRVAVAFRKVLGVSAGARVLLLVDDPNDLALLVHGSLIAGLVPCLIEEDLTADPLARVVQALGPELVIFPPDASARIASLSRYQLSVRSWIVTGNLRTYGSAQKMERFEALMSAAAGESFSPPEKGTAGAVIFVSGRAGKQVAVFRSPALLEAAQTVAASCVVPESEKGHIWCARPLTEFSGCLFSLFLPMFSNLPSLVRPLESIRDFWKQMTADDVSFAIMRQETLAEVYRRGKPRDWLKPDGFTVGIYDRERLSLSLLNGFRERFRTNVYARYFHMECGGILTSSEQPSDELPTRPDAAGDPIPSYGVLLQGVRTRIVSEGGDEGDDLWGSLSCDSGRAPSLIGVSYEDGLVPTGDEGLVSKEDGNARLLFVKGKYSQRITTKGHTLNLSKLDNALREMRGVVFARAVLIPGAYESHEIGVYVVPHRLAQLSRFDVEVFLAERLKDFELPSRYIITDGSQSSANVSEEEMAAAFER